MRGIRCGLHHGAIVLDEIEGEGEEEGGDGRNTLLPLRADCRRQVRVVGRWRLNRKSYRVKLHLYPCLFDTPLPYSVDPSWSIKE